MSQIKRRIAMSLIAFFGLSIIAINIMKTCKKMNPPLRIDRRLPNGMTPEDMHDKAIYEKKTPKLQTIKP